MERQNKPASQISYVTKKTVQRCIITLRYCSHANFVVSEILVPLPPTKIELYSDGEIIKDCLRTVVDIAVPDTKIYNF
jgi:hypothetical protein